MGQDKGKGEATNGRTVPKYHPQPQITGKASSSLTI